MSSSRNAINQSLISTLSMGSAGGVRGLLLMVRGEVRLDSLPLSHERKTSLLEEVEKLASSFNEARHGLPPRAFCYRFPSCSLLVLYSRWSSLFILLDADADLGDVESAGRRLVATAHLGGMPRIEESLVPLLPPEPPPEKSKKRSGPSLRQLVLEPPPPPEKVAEVAPKITSQDIEVEIANPSLSVSMSWKDATNALESILTKVLTHAQAARMIERAMKDRGIQPEGTFDIDLYREIGMEMMGKIPHRVLRKSLTGEFEALLETL